MKILTEEKAEKLIAKHVPVAKSILTKNFVHADKAANKFKYPVVLKLISPKAVHKTEVNGIRFPKNVDELKKEYADLQKIAKTKKLPLTGILVQEMIRGEEVILGIKKDPTFGHVLLFGIGGKYAELLKDVSFRACPITEKDAQAMIDELKMKKILYGFRGSKSVNLRLLKKIMISVSKIPVKHKNIEEMDINPFIINSKTGKAVDARIVMKN
ncbi:MAG: acetate--CoA ligase family protein [Candidatus Aenigmarchaeota archaeon]|nr:acetate--CoA ligase family protein [Candidatus Aenigmarchaeota archaeon]